MRRGLEILGWAAALIIFAFASHAALAQDARHEREQQEQQSPHRRARKMEDEEELSPAAIVRAARTLYVRPSARLDKKYLEYKLQKYSELRDWRLLIVEDERAADLVLSVDQTAMNYIFRITDPRTSAIVVSGKVVAINDLVAAEYLGKEIIKKIRDVRASATPEPSKKKRPRERDDEDEESESRK